MDHSDLTKLITAPEAALGDPDPARRRLAVAALAAADDGLRPEVRERLEAMVMADPEPTVRVACAEALGTAGPDGVPALLQAGTDSAVEVVEAVAFALGEIGDPSAVPWLLELAGGDGDSLAREAAVASLGALGDDRALPLLLDLVRSGPPQIRRRSVVALTGFDTPAAHRAIREARADRNPMVREAAEMVVGRGDELPAPPC